MSFLYCYLSRKRLGLLLSTIVGAMVWPICLYLGCLLLCFLADYPGKRTLDLRRTSVHPRDRPDREPGRHALGWLGR